jgi:polyisoprenoid-binding protein YceI
MQLQAPKSGGRQSVWIFDPSHTTVEFSIKNLFFFNVKGQLSVLEGTIVLDEEDITQSSVVATLSADSIATGVKRRDKHLRASGFLDAGNYPNILFKSSSVGPGDDRDMLRVKGLLTVAGKTGQVELAVSEVDRSRSPQGEEVIYYCATAELDRFDFGLRYGRGVIGRSMKVAINVQASQVPAPDVVAPERR